MMVVYLMELSGQAGSMTGQAEQMSWKCWGGFPEEGPLGRELRVRWSYPGGGGGGRGETSRERVRSGGERKRQGCRLAPRVAGVCRTSGRPGREDQDQGCSTTLPTHLNNPFLPLHPSQVYRPLCPLPAPHTLCPSRQRWPPFISKTPGLAHRGLGTEDAH